MRARPRRLEARSAWFELGLLLLATTLLAQTSFAVAVGLAVTAVVVFRLRWWIPWAAGMALLPAITALAASGHAGAADRLSGLLVVYVAISLGLVLVAERRRARA